MKNIFKYRHQKGEYGYLNERKRRVFLHLLFLLCVAALIFVLGLALNKWQTNNIFTVIAILFVLPGARTLINFIVMAPYKKMSNEEFQELKALERSGWDIYYDAVFSTPEKIRRAKCMIFTGESLLIYLDKDEVKIIDDYFSNIFNKRMSDVRLFVTGEKQSFIRAIMINTESITDDMTSGQKDIREFVRVSVL
ncbi:MAG: hypothetical protein MJ113_04570 [Lachnospiraceae bacterium]|nr:hypothetical protein [Lachnospiraceae bacterium]